MNNPDPVTTGHAYDGIQEFDNPLPGWWKWMFVGSIVFSVFYALYFHVGAPGRSVADQYDAELAAVTRLLYNKIGDLEGDEQTLVKYMAEDSWMKVGQGLYKTNCISCHGAQAEGKIGPNLTDEAFKNIRKIEDIVRVIRKGAAKGAMPAWENRLGQNDIVLLSAYVASLRGENVPGKDPDGKEIPPWPAYEGPPADAEDSEENPDESAGS